MCRAWGKNRLQRSELYFMIPAELQFIPHLVRECLLNYMVVVYKYSKCGFIKCVFKDISTDGSDKKSNPPQQLLICSRQPAVTRKKELTKINYSFGSSQYIHHLIFFLHYFFPLTFRKKRQKTSVFYQLEINW